MPRVATRIGARKNTAFRFFELFDGSNSLLAGRVIGNSVWQNTTRPTASITNNVGTSTSADDWNTIFTYPGDFDITYVYESGSDRGAQGTDYSIFFYRWINNSNFCCVVTYNLSGVGHVTFQQSVSGTSTNLADYTQTTYTAVSPVSQHQIRVRLVGNTTDLWFDDAYMGQVTSANATGTGIGFGGRANDGYAHMIGRTTDLLPFSDDFNRANGAPGNGWLDLGDFGRTGGNGVTIITSNHVQPTGGLSGYGANFGRNIGRTYGIDIQADALGNDSYKVMLFGGTVGNSGTCAVVLTNGTSYVQIGSNQRTIGGAVSGNQTMRVTVSTAGLITAYYGGTQVGTYQMTSGEIAATTGTHVGMGTYQQAWDNFSAKAF